MPLVYESEVPDPQAVLLRDPAPAVVEWQGHKALRLSGEGACLLVVPGLSLEHGTVEVEIGAQGPAYPGIAFRLLDSLNYELAYAQPHTSGMWDALQYDPVFHGSNTWQLYHGAGCQIAAQVPTGSWFKLRVAFRDRRVMVKVGEQEPLWVEPLAHAQQSGLVGLWSYLPAHFRSLRIYDDLPEFPARSSSPQPGPPAAGSLAEWFLEGYGVVTSEPNGILNINRYLPVSTTEVRLQHDIELSQDGELTFTLGFSDELSLQVDGQEVYHGENLWHNTPVWSERGYVSLNQQLTQHLTKGRHRLTAVLKMKEYFGYGIALRVEGNNYQFLPARLVR